MAFIHKKEKNKQPTILNIPDELWNEIESIFPKEKPLKTVDRPIIPIRKEVDGIIYLLQTLGIQWKILPK